MSVQGILLDIDGVLFEKGVLLPDAQKALALLRERRVPFLLLSNTSQRSRRALTERFRAWGVEVRAEEIVSSLSEAADFLRRESKPTRILVRPQAREELEGIPPPTPSPAYVLLGDLGDDLRAGHLNQALRDVLSGADLVATGRTLLYLAEDGWALDVGAFVEALEKATGKRAKTLGKPEPDFFLSACRRMGLPPEKVAMIGDDLEIDVLPAHNLGMEAVLVRTGKGSCVDPSKAPKIRRNVLEAVEELLGFTPPPFDPQSPRR